MLKTQHLHPPLPQARQDMPLPEVRSRLVQVLNVAMGKEPVSAAQGWVGEIEGTLPVLATPASRLGKEYVLAHSGRVGETMAVLSILIG